MKVAVVDTGYEKPNVIADFRDVWDGANRAPVDRLGHGTAMADIVRDIAPDALVYAVRVSEEIELKLWNAMMGISAACFEFQADVINLSFGLSTSIRCDQCGQGIANCQNCGHDLPVISHILKSLQGIAKVDAGGAGPPVIVSATGNKGHQSVDKPADYDLAIAGFDQQHTCSLSVQ